MKLTLRSVATLMVLGLTIAASFAQPRPWMIKGEAIVTCPCHVPCPCRSNSPPSQPHCENLSYVRVVEGRYGLAKLDGLQYVWAADECVGPSQGRKPTTLYFSKNATREQIDAIERIMTGEHCSGKKPEEMRAYAVDLSAGAGDSLYSIRVGKKAQLDVDLMPGTILMEPLPALDLWGNTVAYARNITARIDDEQAGLRWDFSGLQANYRTFESTSELRETGLLLGLFRDDAGKFNEMHRSLIRELHLEVPISKGEFRQMLDQVHLPARRLPAQVRFDEHGSVGGAVLDDKGKPRSGARLQIVPTAAGFPQLSVTNPNGRYFFAHVPVGKYQLCASTWDGKISMRSCLEATVGTNRVLNLDLRLATPQAATTQQAR